MHSFFQNIYRKLFQALNAWTDGIVSLIKEPYKWVLHPSIWRLRWIGVFILFGNPMFYLVWTQLVPQPFESLAIRLCTSVLGLILLIKSEAILRGCRFWQRFYALALFLQLPLIFLGMAFMNGFNAVWLGSCAAMVLIYYQLSDWRIASVGTLVVTICICILCYQDTQLFLTLPTVIFALIFVFSWVCAIVAGGSTANILKQNLQNTALNLGVMAHELRTPIASISLLNHILKKLAVVKNDTELEGLATKLSLLVKTLNQHIDDQIANSKQSRDGAPTQKTSAFAIVQQAISNYPFISEKERNAVLVTCEEDFYFYANGVLFAQVLNNLIKNALRAIRAKEISESEMRLAISITPDRNKLSVRYRQYFKRFSQKPETLTHGQIVVSDNGCGIHPSELQSVLQPFVSSAEGLGHGLGLPFCKRVLEDFDGQLAIQSELNIGTSITLTLPIYRPEK